MKTVTSRHCSMIATFLSILLAVVLAATGCAPKVVPAKGPQISGMMLTNVTASAYDAVPLVWNVRQNTLQSTGTSVLHVDNTNGEGGLFWSSGSPLLAVQHWSRKDDLPLMTATSTSLSLLVPPVTMRHVSATNDLFVRWCVLGENEFFTAPGELRLSSSQKTLDGRTLVIGLNSLEAEAVPVPSGLTHMVTLYGSGSLDNGFVFVEASEANAAKNAADSLWLLRMNHRIMTWVRCGDASAFGGGLYSGQSPSFARVGTLLYFTHSRTKIGCIDTAATSPSVTLPETLNTLLAKLYSEGPTDAEYPIQAHLASDSDTLILEYPDMFWNSVYYAVDVAGTVLGSLRADKTSIVSFDAKGQQGFTLKTPGSPGYVSFPSIDLFESPVS